MKRKILIISVLTILGVIFFSTQSFAFTPRERVSSDKMEKGAGPANLGNKNAAAQLKGRIKSYDPENPESDKNADEPNTIYVPKNCDTVECSTQVKRVISPSGK